MKLWLNGRKDSDNLKVNVCVLNKAGLKPLINIRLTLIKENKEIESYEAASGSAVFNKLNFGQYAILATYKNEEIGVVKLEIK